MTKLVTRMIPVFSVQAIVEHTGPTRYVQGTRRVARGDRPQRFSRRAVWSQRQGTHPLPEDLGPSSGGLGQADKDMQRDSRVGLWFEMKDLSGHTLLLL